VDVPQGDWRTRVTLGLASAVVIAGVWLRFQGLELQSYWIDELFSVVQARGGFAHAVSHGGQEIHPPTFALLLAAWIKIFGASEVATRSMSAVFGTIGVVAAAVLLRRTDLPRRVVHVLVAGTAASGFAITYAQDTRSLSLLWMCGVGVTAAVVGLCGGQPDNDRFWWRVWIGFSLLATATHLFGLALVAGSVGAILLVKRPVRLAPVAIRAGVAVLPQAVWLTYGALVPGFAARTSWIRPPSLTSAKVYLTTVFAWSDLNQRSSGFQWFSWWLLLGISIVLVLGVTQRVLRRGGRSRPLLTTPLRRQVLALGLMSAIGIGMPFVGSLVIPVWLVRNGIVMAPALSWFVLALAVSAPTRELGRFAAAVVVIVLLGAGLWPISANLRTPYKTDFRSLVLYLDSTRRAHPQTRFVLSTEKPAQWIAAGPVPQTAEYRRWLLGPGPVLLRPWSFDRRIGPPTGPTVYVWYAIANPNVAAGRAERIRELTAPTCAVVPIRGISVVDCSAG
jgi:uncharacterized membrane protein